ncbi:MAG: hypothetical protein WBO34_00990 [Gammaproteobacteria bacterium]
MRLLEFESADSGSKPQAARLTKKPAKKPLKKAASPQQDSRPTSTPGQVFAPHDEPAVHQPVRRLPIDIEQLQQRIEVLERRMRERVREVGGQLPVKDLELLKQRMKLLERSVHTELWAAKQREHTLLEMLARPPLRQLIRDRAKRLHSHTLPATRLWCANVGLNWWEENKPLWWPRFASAWQESLDKARGSYNT